MSTAEALAVGRIREALDALPDEVSRQNVLREVLSDRCPTCLEKSPAPRWCCYDSRGD